MGSPWSDGEVDEDVEAMLWALLLAFDVGLEEIMAGAELIRGVSQTFVRNVGTHSSSSRRFCGVPTPSAAQVWLDRCGEGLSSFPSLAGDSANGVGLFRTGVMGVNGDCRSSGTPTLSEGLNICLLWSSTCVRFNGGGGISVVRLIVGPRGGENASACGEMIVIVGECGVSSVPKEDSLEVGL